MLHKLDLVYDDGRKESKIIYTKPGEQVTIYPQRDGIKSAGHKVFKYEFDEWKGLCPAIVKLGGVKKILPWGIECHPNTKITDIIVTKIKPIKPKSTKETFKFKSSSGGGTYKVTKDGDTIKCDCMGFWRSKGNCKHVKEVRGQ